MYIRPFESADTLAAIQIWNRVIADGVAFPQLYYLDEQSGAAFFQAQTHTAVAEIDGEIMGLYILHPNKEGRCGHIGNASYAVRHDARGKKIGEALIRDSIRMAREKGFRLMQFNAVVKNNYSALHLYEKLGFVKLGEIPGGFRMKDESYQDIVLFYRKL